MGRQVEGAGGRLSGMGAGELETTVEALGGRLAVRSRAEGGTTVEARVPGPPARLEGRPA